MTGTWLRRHTPKYGPGPLHRCEPPMRKDERWPTLDYERPDGDDGFLWRCSCGKLWEVTEYPLETMPTHRMPPSWRKAGFWLRIQYRRRHR